MKNNWILFLKRFVRKGFSDAERIGPADPETIAPILLCLLQKRSLPLFVLMPLLSNAEQSKSEFDEWVSILGLKVRSLLLPEGSSASQALLASDAPRAKALFHLLNDPPDIVFASANAFLSPAPNPATMKKTEMTLSCGMEISIPELAEKLVGMEYDDEQEVAVPGEFARRGGLVDIFSTDSDLPARIEFWGDVIDSIRLFHPETQRTLRTVDTYRVILRSGGQNAEEGSWSLADYLPFFKPQLVICDPGETDRHVERYSTESDFLRWREFIQKSSYGKSAIQILDTADAAASKKAVQPPRIYPANAQFLRAAAKETEHVSSDFAWQITASLIRQWQTTGVDITLLGKQKGDLEHIHDWLKKQQIDANGINIETGHAPNGLFLPEERAVFLPVHDLFALPKHTRTIDKNTEKVPLLARMPEQDYGSASCGDLEDGDYAVHVNYGICQFRGFRIINAGGVKSEMLELLFADDMVIDIPAWQAHFLSRYIGSKAEAVSLSKLNSTRWGKTKTEAAVSVRNLALDLLQTQASRETGHGVAFPKDDLQQKLFEESFPFHETPHQLKSTEEIKQDMESEKPMDRLLCGDVGYGKTEIAMRAAFKCVSSGKQCAVLVPTTVLAQQHYYSFMERFSSTPVIIEQLSRFKTKGQQADIINRLKEGTVDIVIGTHRLVQSDVGFKDLGLIIIDEEQRFGVAHKERLKKLRATVDILTMTATPIPRTLYLSMSGLRDMSTIMSAPVQRLPIQTVFAQENSNVIRMAVDRELQRGGQVYYLYNRVASIDREAEKLRVLFPGVSIEVAHGQMPKNELEDVMSDFIEGKIRILVCTTIIESGLDIPNANTIIIDRADRFGLAELYQLRGRVGRWTRQAYAVMLLPRSGIITGDARKRISAIRRYTHLGAGFNLAMSDLEIRGAGNILGQEQSGQINAIGFNLYCELLKNCVAMLSGKPAENTPNTDLFFDFCEYAVAAPNGKCAAGFPPEYINADRLRFHAYRRLALISSEESLDNYIMEIQDRFGKIPKDTENLFLLARIRILASKLGIDSLACRENTVYMERRSHFVKENGMIPRLVPSSTPESKLKQVCDLLRRLSRAAG